MHGSIQVLIQAHKCPQSILTPLICSYPEQTSVKTNVIDAYTHALLPGMQRNFKWVYLATNGTRTTCYSVHFYTNVGVLAPYMTFYDAKLQLVKTPIEGKLSTISPNHTCQCSLLILSYNISHFPLHTTFKYVAAEPYG